MAGLAVGLVTGRRELVAAISGAVIGVGVSLAWDPAAGIIAGGVLGPVLGLLVRPKAGEVEHDAALAFRLPASEELEHGHEHGKLA